MDFFRHREGKWSSWRVTHHLAFQRSESGESEISMQVLPPDDERIVSLCKDWEVEPSTTQGGCYVTWKATMAWDQEGENHEGSTVFALVPETEDRRRGKILRDRGYAEIVPIAGTFYLDDNDDLNLETPYEGGAVDEQFSFDGPNIVNRTSTVKRFGGLSTATFSTERRIGADTIVSDEECDMTHEELMEAINEVSLFGPSPDFALTDNEAQATLSESSTANSAFTGRNRWGTVNITGRPSASSAFGTGFSGANTTSGEVPATSAFATSSSSAVQDSKPTTEPQLESDVDNAGGSEGNGISSEILAAAERAGIDLTKIPPSMRDDFLASLQSESDNTASR